VTFFGLTTLDLHEAGDDSAWVRLRAFDASDSMIDNHVRYGPEGPSGLDLNWSVHAAGIMRVRLLGDISINHQGYGVDDLMLVRSPEPVPTLGGTGLALIGIAVSLIGIAFVYRRRTHRQATG